MKNITVIYFKDRRSRIPAKTFLDTLSKTQQAKILRVLLLIQKHGVSPAIPHIKKLSGIPLWEIKIRGKTDIRILFATPAKDTVLVLHGFKKKTQKTPKTHIQKSLNRLEEWRDCKTNA